MIFKKEKAAGGNQAALESADMTDNNQLSQTNQQQEVEIVCMSDIAEKPIEWLWPDRIASGKLTVIAGNPGLGKSQLTASLAAIVSKSMEWPDRLWQDSALQGNVIFLSAEDDAADTIKPRLLAAGADVSRCHILMAVKEEGKVRSFYLTKDVERLANAIEKIGNVRLVIIDPVSAYLGGTDSYKDADMRGLLKPLSDMAAKYNTAVILVSHFNKSEKQEATARVNGSIALVAAARAAYAVVKDVANPEIRYFVPIKNNIGNDKNGFSFKIEDRQLEGNIKTSRVRWDANLVDAHRILYPEKQEDQGANSTADFLRELLLQGAKPAKDIFTEAEEAGYGKTAIRGAARKIGVCHKKEGMSGGWIWSLPASKEDKEDGIN